MNTTIEVADVASALLNDGWHSVVPGSFNIGPYQFVRGDDTLMRGGAQPLVSSYGFSFEDDNGSVIAGPVSALLGVSSREMAEASTGATDTAGNENSAPRNETVDVHIYVHSDDHVHVHQDADDTEEK